MLGVAVGVFLMHALGVVGVLCPCGGPAAGAPDPRAPRADERPRGTHPSEYYTGCARTVVYATKKMCLHVSSMNTIIDSIVLYNVKQCLLLECAKQWATSLVLWREETTVFHVGKFSFLLFPVIFQVYIVQSLEVEEGEEPGFLPPEHESFSPKHGFVVIHTQGEDKPQSTRESTS